MTMVRAHLRRSVAGTGLAGILAAGLATPALPQAAPVSQTQVGQIDKRVIDVIYVLKCLNPGAHGKAITGATA
jgi:hypothetical protein